LPTFSPLSIPMKALEDLRGGGYDCLKMLF